VLRVCWTGEGEVLAAFAHGSSQARGSKVRFEVRQAFLVRRWPETSRGWLLALSSETYMIGEYMYLFVFSREREIVEQW
jgi:hypothetical protein